VKLVTEDFSGLRIAEDKVNVQVLVSPKKSVRKIRSIPVEMEGGRRADVRPNFVDIEVSGKKDFLESLKPYEVRAFVDVAGLESGWQERKVRVLLPGALQVHKLAPETVSVRPLQ
jgi:YbbR domain-containing protein